MTLFSDRLLAPDGSRDDAFKIAKGRLFLVQAKYQGLERTLISYIPEAVGQAIALLKSEKCVSPAPHLLRLLRRLPFSLAEVRFCLSDGQRWIFFILKSENGTLTYYESAIRSLSRETLEGSELPLCEIVQLGCEWVSFSVDPHICFS